MKAPNLPDRITGKSNGTPIDNTYFDRQWGYLTNAVNGIDADNFNGGAVTLITPSSPDTDFTVPHKLARVPTGWLLLSIDAAGIVYKGSVKWTSKSITLRCNIASANVVLVVV